MSAAWECPRCKAINAPHALQCPCKPAQQLSPDLVPYIPPTVPPWQPDPFVPWWTGPTATFVSSTALLPDVTICGGVLMPGCVMMNAGDHGVSSAGT